ncbi:MAG: hypothetical protein ACKO27_07785 [Ilumatobacteraceae bacterium]
MPDPTVLPMSVERPAHYVTAEDALHYASYFNAVAGGRGWSRAVMEENLPGWTLNEFMALCDRHRLFTRGEAGGRSWRSPDVVGVAIDGESVIKDRGDLVHLAKSTARRRVDIGHTSSVMRHLRGDDSAIVLHVRSSAATPDERKLHEVAREAYLASSVRPSLVLNVSHMLVDPFDPPSAGLRVVGSPLDEAMNSLVRSYEADFVSLLEHERSRHDTVVLLTLATHDGGEPIEINDADAVHLPPSLRPKRASLVSKTMSLRSDSFADPQRVSTVEALTGLISGFRSVNE